MTADNQFRISALLSVQRALWDMVTPELRTVTLRVDQDLVHVRMIYEHEPTDDEQELVSEVETEVVADFLPEVEVRFVADAVPPPARVELLPGEETVYRRHESTATP